MESWRHELYTTLSHSIEGSTWKDHKYVAIIDGKYIYPEDLKKMNSSERASVTSNNSRWVNSNKTSSKSEKKETLVDLDAKGNIVKVDKGSVKSYKDLPEDPEVGDMYYLEDTKTKVYWDGNMWTPVEDEEEQEQKPKKITGGGGGDKKETSESISNDVISRAREAMQKLMNKRSSGSSTSNIMVTSVPSLANSPQIEKGKSALSSLLEKVKSVFSKAVTAVKSTKVYQAGVNFVSNLRGK